MLAGRLIVAHDASFDVAFLRAEFARPAPAPGTASVPARHRHEAATRSFEPITITPQLSRYVRRGRYRGCMDTSTMKPSTSHADRLLRRVQHAQRARNVRPVPAAALPFGSPTRGPMRRDTAIVRFLALAHPA